MWKVVVLLVLHLLCAVITTVNAVSSDNKKRRIAWVVFAVGWALCLASDVIRLISM